MSAAPTEEPAGLPAPTRARTLGCLALMLGPSLLGGAGLIVSALPRLGSDSRAALALLGAGIFTLLGGVVMLVIMAPLLRLRGVRPGARETYPAEPWRWRDDWAAGLVEGQPLGVSAALALTRFHDVRLTLATRPIAIGRECAGRIEIAQGAERLDFSRPLSCVLRCVHRRRTGSGQSASEIEYWRDEQAVPLEPFARGARAAWKAGIPADRPATTLGPMDDRVRWELRVQQEIDGADLDFTFELPVFRVDGATEDATSGAGIASALAMTPAVAPVPPAPASGIQLVRDGTGLRVTVAAGRHAPFAWLLLGLLIVFGGAAAAQLIAGSRVEALLLLLLVPPLLYGVLWLRYRRVEIQATGERLAVDTILLGIRRRREIAAVSVREMQMVVGMTAGSTPYWDVRATPVSGAAFTVVPSMADEAGAKYLTTALAAVLRVPVAPPDRRLPEGAEPR